ncbi:MAG: OmpH family outer membrane protein [Bacteroidales bacterium]|nr:OmpH family outer membrane protein [Bacteroidales bacterium]
MKKIFTLTSILALSAVCLSSCNNTANTPAKAAEGTVVAAQGSIVYFDLDRVLEQYDMANDKRSEVETKVATIQQEVTRRQKNLENAINDFQNKINKGLMTSAAAQAQQQKLQEQDAAFQQFAQQKQAEIMEEQQVMMNVLADAIKTYIEKYNQEKGFAMILTNQAGVPVIAGDESLNITDEIIEGLNKEYVKSKKAE